MLILTTGIMFLCLERIIAGKLERGKNEAKIGEKCSLNAILIIVTLQHVKFSLKAAVSFSCKNCAENLYYFKNIAHLFENDFGNCLNDVLPTL